MSSALSISVVLPTFNRLDRLKRVLAALEKQEFPKDQFEVIVISDGSTDGTDAYLQTVKTEIRLIPIFQPNQGPGAARNTGMAIAKGDLIVFIDDDVIPIPQLLEEHARSHQFENCDVAVIGPMLTPPDWPLPYWLRWGQEKLGEQYKSMIENEWKPVARQFYTGNASFPRRLYQRYGGFDEAFHRAEDVELAYRYERHGVVFRFNPKAIGYHYEERSFASWAKIAYEYGRFDVVFTTKKNTDWLLSTIFQEFRQRPRLIQWVIFACLGRQKLSRAAVQAFNWLANAGDKLGMGLLQRTGCSAVFNLNYYQGVADEMGGRKAFFHSAYPATYSMKPES